MKAKKLVEELLKLDPDIEIHVYGRASISSESDFGLEYDLQSDLVRLVPSYYKGDSPDSL